MSSNTLRGIGQEGDGDGASGQTAGHPEAGTQPAAAGQVADPLDVRKVRSLDSTVPGTRSLDSSVPEASPSLDGKVPSFAATMMGMTAPNIPGRNAAENGRDKGTVQGRDVHLPVEMQRRAGVIPVPADGGPRLDPAHDPGARVPTAAEPVRVQHGAPELNSHGPWYDQEPAGADAYDDPRPNLIGRVAIGAAIAASLSVVLFAIVRVRAQGQAQEAEVVPQAPPAPMNAAVPAAAPAVPREPSVDDRPPPPVIDWDGDRLEVPPAAAVEPSRRPAAKGPAAASRPAPSSGPTVPRVSAGTKGPPVAPLPNNLFRPKALDDVPTPATPTEPPAASATPPSGAGASPVPVGTAVQPPAPIPTPPPAATTAPAGVPADAPTPAKPKGKTYDPDSTLPLNAE